MVATAGSAKSSMEIKGTLDTNNIEIGLTRIKKGFESTLGQVKSFGSDMQRVATTVGGLAKKMVFLGVAGITAMVGIASKAPAVAPAIAKMGVEFGKLSRSLGEALAPAFEKVAGWMGRVASWVDQNKDKIESVANAILNVSEKIGGAGVDYIKLWINEYSTLIDKIKTAKKEMDEKGMFSDKTEEDFKFNVPLKKSTAVGVGLAAGLYTKNPIVGGVSAGLTYGGLDQFERTTEFKSRTEAGEEILPAAFKSFAPGPIGDFYAWMYNLFAGAQATEDRRMQTTNQEDQSWG